MSPIWTVKMIWKDLNEIKEKVGSPNLYSYFYDWFSHLVSHNITSQHNISVTESEIPGWSNSLIYFAIS